MKRGHKLRKRVQTLIDTDREPILYHRYIIGKKRYIPTVQETKRKNTHYEKVQIHELGKRDLDFNRH